DAHLGRLPRQRRRTAGPAAQGRRDAAEEPRATGNRQARVRTATPGPSARRIPPRVGAHSRASPVSATDRACFPTYPLFETLFEQDWISLRTPSPLPPFSPTPPEGRFPRRLPLHVR